LIPGALNPTLLAETDPGHLPRQFKVAKRFKVEATLHRAEGDEQGSWVNMAVDQRKDASPSPDQYGKLYTVTPAPWRRPRGNLRQEVEPIAALLHQREARAPLGVR
jgi:hypothetical protein